VQLRLVQALGIASTLAYGGAVVWLYATAPRSLAEVGTNAQVAAGTYQVDEARFQAGRELFRREQYAAAREEFGRADPAQRDARVQFYVAYAFYRQGWGRMGSDDALFRQGLAAVQRAQSLSAGTLRVPDVDLKLQSGAELQAELQKGLDRTWSDFNPMRVLEERK
jgi:hypothetical protein